jgi:hypothetical protein
MVKEITDKLAHELLDKLVDLESWCDKKIKEGRPQKGDVDTDWLIAASRCYDIRVHLSHHMEDMIHHPDYES